MIKLSTKLLVFIIVFSSITIALADEPMTQEEFAVELVKNMGLEDQLPIAALPKDCVDLLESMGITPLKGWDRKALLKDDDFTVLIAKAVGKENVVHVKASELCHKNIDVINCRWEDFPDLKLEELLQSEDLFPIAIPECPYGLKYIDEDNNHDVDQHYHPIIHFAR